MDRRATKNADGRELRQQRWELLGQLSRILEPPMIALAFVWLALMIYELVFGSHWILMFINYTIWGVFVVDFVIKLVIAPRKKRYIRSNWLTIVSLLVPALRVARLFRLLRFTRIAGATGSLRLVRLLGSMNRSIRAARTTLARRGAGYVVVVTAMVAFAGAAGMLAFENNASLREAGYSSSYAGLNSYGEAVWWTAMLMTTMGSDYWPRTTEGRILTVFLALYAFAVFGYITGTIASHFIGQDAERDKSNPKIARELADLRAQIEQLITSREKIKE